MIEKASSIGERQSESHRMATTVRARTCKRFRYFTHRKSGLLVKSAQTAQISVAAGDQRRKAFSLVGYVLVFVEERLVSHLV